MVACVVVNWNGWRDTVACLRTLATQSTADDLTVIIVDNGSTNDSVAQLESFVTEVAGTRTSFHLIRNTENVGFARGANIGIRQGLQNGAEFVWLLNNDTECPPDTLEKLLRVARPHTNVGIVGTVLYYFDDPSKVQAWSGGRINRWLGTTIHFYAPYVDGPGTYTTFASALIRSEVFRDVGLLYEGFFMYYDDADLCLRMEKTHWAIAVADDTAVLHKEGASTEGVRNPFMEKTIAVSGLRLLKRHSPLPLLSQIAFIALKLANRARRGEWAAVRAVFQAVSEYCRDGVPAR